MIRIIAICLFWQHWRAVCVHCAMVHMIVDRMRLLLLMLLLMMMVGFGIMRRGIVWYIASSWIFCFNI